MLETLRDEMALPLQPAALPTRDWGYVQVENSRDDESRISGLIDGLKAYRKAVWKAFMTPRFRYAIYPSDYGSEFHLLIGETVEYAKARLPRMIEDCLRQDSRYVSHKIVSMTSPRARNVLVKLEISSTEGLLNYNLSLALEE